MTRAGEKLYGDWQRLNDEIDLDRARHRRALRRGALPLAAGVLLTAFALVWFG